MQDSRDEPRYSYVSIKIKPETYQLLIDLKTQMIKLSMRGGKKRDRRITEDYVIRKALELLKTSIQDLGSVEGERS